MNRLVESHLIYLDGARILESVEPELNPLPNVRTIRKYLEDAIADRLLDVVIYD